MDILQHTFGRYQNEKVTEITLVNDNGVEVVMPDDGRNLAPVRSARK